MSSAVTDDSAIRVGVSSCLLGESVRWDANHKRDGFVADTLARFVDLIPVCPEVELGLGIPREAIRLVADSDRDGVRLRGRASGDDHTTAMRRLARSRSKSLAGLDLCGYVFKSKSPSCGLFRVPIYREGQSALRSGRGLFAEVLTAALPLLPVEEDGRLNDAKLREAFVERVFAYARLRRAMGPRWRLRDLVDFHSNEKLLLLAHHPQIYRELGRVVARAKQRERAELAEHYRERFMSAMARPASVGRQVNVLLHMAGYFRDCLDSSDRGQLADVIEDYRNLLVPLIVPVTLIRFFARRFEVAYLLRQSYLNPHPKELMLRNHV